MALDRLLALIADQGVEPRLDAVSRWTETPAEAVWDPEPEYGAFVDDEGRVVTGSAPARAFLETDDPSKMELAPQTARDLDDDVTVVFVDWGRQSLSWEEIFELWAIWEAEDRIAGCGAVSVPWSLASRWIAPGWVAFRGELDGAPLSVSVCRTAEAPSFLARARKLRSGEISAPAAEGEEETLPMLPFTLDDLKDPRRTWPEGVV